jgi:hypothetical protein
LSRLVALLPGGKSFYLCRKILKMYLRLSFLLIWIPFFLYSCGGPQVTGEKPDSAKSAKLLSLVIRYVAPLPPNVSDSLKWDKLYDAYYRQQIDAHSVDLYYQNPKTGEEFLLVSRIAPSMQVKRVATGISLKMEGNKLHSYREVFRTWRMPEAELALKGELLFRLMATGGDLKPYYRENSGEEEYIEFPDPNTTYNEEKRQWESKLEYQRKNL